MPRANSALLTSSEAAEANSSLATELEAEQQQIIESTEIIEELSQKVKSHKKDVAASKRNIKRLEKEIAARFK